MPIPQFNFVSIRSRSSESWTSREWVGRSDSQSDKNTIITFNDLAFRRAFEMHLIDSQEQLTQFEMGKCRCLNKLPSSSSRSHGLNRYVSRCLDKFVSSCNLKCIPSAQCRLFLRLVEVHADVQRDRIDDMINFTFSTDTQNHSSNPFQTHSTSNRNKQYVPQSDGTSRCRCTHSPRALCVRLIRCNCTRAIYEEADLIR